MVSPIKRKLQQPKKQVKPAMPKQGAYKCPMDEKMMPPQRKGR